MDERAPKAPDEALSEAPDSVAVSITLAASAQCGDPRDVIAPAIDLARELEWKYVKIPLWAAEAAMVALHTSAAHHMHQQRPPRAQVLDLLADESETFNQQQQLHRLLYQWVAEV